MNDPMALALCFMAGLMVLLIAMGLGVAAIMPGIERWSRRFFIAFFSVLALAIVALFVDAFTYDVPELAMVDRVAVYFEYLFISIPMPMLTAYLLHCCGEDLRKSPLLRAALLLWLVYFALLVIAQFTQGFYHIVPGGQFSHGPYHPLLILPLILILALTLAGLIRWRSRLSGKYFAALLIHLIPMSAALLLEMFVYVPLAVDIGISMCALAMFGIILTDQVERYVRQQQEIARQRASIMVLQMRPHFICNTMMSIYYLCRQDPDKAQQVTLDFTTYLRKNFTAIASEDTVPFAGELEHTRAYLAVEQAQFEDRLYVEFHTPHTRFRVPPLTLQPIVENAVKHGMDPDAEPLRIRIETRETSRGSEITVTDNGAGWEPAGGDEPHTALENIRQRLDMMCGGRLDIAPRPGGGTVVTMVIP